MLHSHLRMTGTWRVCDGRAGAAPPRARWLVIAPRRARGRRVRRARAGADDRRRARASTSGSRASGRTSSRRELDEQRSCAACARTTRRAPIGDALLDQRIVAGHRQHVEGRGLLRGAGSTRGGRAARCPTRRRWRSSRATRPRMLRVGRARHAGRASSGLRPAGRPCPRCGDRRSASRGQGDDNRTTYWCPRCQRLSARIGHKGADLIEPGNTPARFDAALDARRGHDRVRRAARAPDGRRRQAPARARLRRRRAAR